MALATLAAVKAAQTPLVSIQKQIPANLPTHIWESAWGTTGNITGAFDTTLNGVTLTNPVTGQIPFDDPPSGNAYLSRLELVGRCGQNAVPADLYLCDRLWHNGGIDATGATGAQAIVSPAWPARDDDGATAGKGVLLAVEYSTTVTIAGTPTVTVSYTNSAGVSGRTATNIVAIGASVPLGVTHLLSLQSGDVGVRSVESVTPSASPNNFPTGIINLVAFRLLAHLPGARPDRPSAVDAVTGCLPRLFAGTVPYLMGRNAAQNSAFAMVNGQIGYALG